MALRPFNLLVVEPRCEESHSRRFDSGTRRGRVISEAERAKCHHRGGSQGRAGPSRDLPCSRRSRNSLRDSIGRPGKLFLTCRPFDTSFSEVVPQVVLRSSYVSAVDKILYLSRDKGVSDVFPCVDSSERLCSCCSTSCRFIGALER